MGSFSPNPWGLFDMEGNAYSWVEDCFADNGSDQHGYMQKGYADGLSDGSARTNCPPSRYFDGVKVVRGAAWIPRLLSAFCGSVEASVVSFGPASRYSSNYYALSFVVADVREKGAPRFLVPLLRSSAATGGGGYLAIGSHLATTASSSACF